MEIPSAYRPGVLTSGTVIQAAVYRCGVIRNCRSGMGNRNAHGEDIKQTQRDGICKKIMGL